jgi:CheY-like chemotaxis protein
MRIQDIQVLVATGASNEAGRVSRSLKEMGLQTVTTVTDGYSALIALKKMQPELLLLEWTLAKMDAEQVLRYIRAIPRFRMPKVLAMVGETGDAQTQTPTKEIEKKGAELGVGAYLVSPFTGAVLQGQIEKEMRMRIL